MLPFIGHNTGRAELAWLTGSGLGWARSESLLVSGLLLDGTQGHCPVQPSPEDAEMLTLHPLLCVMLLLTTL